MRSSHRLAGTAALAAALVTSACQQANLQRPAAAGVTSRGGASEPTTSNPVPARSTGQVRALDLSSPLQHCRTGPPLANVYHDYRFSVVRACATVSGIVRSVRREDDGDLHVDLEVYPAFEAMLNDANRAYQHGWLVVEIVPADEPGCSAGAVAGAPHGTYDYGRCTGAGILAPSLGQGVAVVGPYVLDHVHDWAEVHPVWWLGPPVGDSGTRAGPTAAGAAPPGAAGPRTVSVVSVVDPVAAGAQERLQAQTQPGSSCTLSVVLPSGRQSTARGLGPATADAQGKVSWTWRVGPTTKPGSAEASVVCGSASSAVTFTVTS